MKRTPHTTHIASAVMSLCNVCRFIPFRKLIDDDVGGIVNDGFRFNSVGRTSPRFSDDLLWNRRRCTVSELESRAKTCRLCADILLRMKEHKWHKLNEIPLTWEEVKTDIPRNLMIYMYLYTHVSPDWNFCICLGRPRYILTHPLRFNFVKTYGKYHCMEHDDTKSDCVL